MSSRKSWQEYLGGVPAERCDLSLYGARWAHDARCARSGPSHRRVGSASQSARTLFAQFVLPVKR